MDHPGCARSGRKFALRIGIRAGLFVLAMFGVPLALYALDRFEGEDVSVHEAIRLTTATVAGFSLYLILALSLIGPCWRRLKELQLPGSGTLLLVFLVLADLPCFIAGRGESSFGSSLSTAGGQIPFYMLSALVVMIGMALLRPPKAGERAAKSFGVAGHAVGVLSILMALDVVVKLAFMKWMSVETDNLGPEDAPSGIFLSVVDYALAAWSLSPLVFVALAGATAWCVVLSRRAPPFTHQSGPAR